MPQGSQATLRASAELKGRGLHTGAEAFCRLLPAPEGTGYVFKRLDLPGAPQVKADLELVTATDRGTVVSQGAASAATIEHLLGALYGLGLDNVLIELNGPEVPILDGSGMEWLKLVQAAGIQEQSAPRDYLDIAEPFHLQDEAKAFSARPSQGLEVLYRVDYHHPALGQQEAHFNLDPASFADSIAPARTFCFEHEVKALQAAGLIKGGDLTCALVVGEQGVLNGPLRYPDEFVRHKVLDFLGDLALIGRRVRGSFTIERGGHRLHVQGMKALRELSRKGKDTRRDAMSTADTGTPLMDIEAIQAMLPHRYPMLLVDRVAALTPKDRITAFKNVSMNEWFFQGHFPGHPIMPGVLIIEGLAQAGGLLVMKSFPDLQGMLTYFMAIDNARFRRPVVPGDVLRFEVVGEKFKGRIVKLNAKAYVGAELACEADLMCMVVEDGKKG